MDSLQEIKNKEIFVEVLHLAVDYLIGNVNEKQTLRSSHKFGFSNPYDFLLTASTLAKYYRQHFVHQHVYVETVPQFSCLNNELKKHISTVLVARKQEIFNYLNTWHFSKKLIVESFLWETKLILGDSFFQGNLNQIITLKIFYSSINLRSKITIEFKKKQLYHFISLLEHSLYK
ncbi:LOW QUALITY PROTEIN: uncharacterized protein LOC26514973 [Drosophila ananassae]|uniref:LOW QUALITY PROTEIN: uncharacterized protein LOC26514973 n=1 Tax=Drosophila ananassae TaxID=7217 RepID=UPI001CFF64B8|nr:LOW QUALITY PROTEIN: uncharacterized protein LOC26514973 [Drosophila ananassae]